MAAVGQRYYTPNPFEFDANGVPLAGAQLFFYTTGTTSLLNTYADVALTTPNPNPVIADANGRFGTIFLTPSTAYKVQLWTAATADNPTGTQVWSEDPVGPAAGGVPTNTAGIVGEVRQFAGPSASVPSGWYLCYGQAVSRTTYASLFAVIGTTWGSGDGTTTFNLPDLRGRAMVGKDDMGGSAASRMTSGTSGINGVTLGATGGDQRFFQHKHTLTDPTHTHAITDPKHGHNAQPSGDFVAYIGGGGNLSFGGSPLTGKATGGTTLDPTLITINSASTGITMANFGSNTTSQNVQPSAIVNMIIYAGA